MRCSRRYSVVALRRSIALGALCTVPGCAGWTSTVSWAPHPRQVCQAPAPEFSLPPIVESAPKATILPPPTEHPQTPSEPTPPEPTAWEGPLPAPGGRDRTEVRVQSQWMPADRPWPNPDPFE